MSHWATKYVGRPYCKHGAGPLSYDCAGLLWRVQQDDFQRECPRYMIDPGNKPLVAEAVEAAAGWVEVKEPVEGCAVAMLQGRDRSYHVGVYTAADGGCVLHATERGGVLCQRVNILASYGWSRIRFYVRPSWSPSSNR